MKWFKKAKQKFTYIFRKGIFDPVKEILTKGERGDHNNIEAYKSIWNVFAIIDHIASLVAELPIKQYEKRAGEKSEIEESDVKNLLFYRANLLDTGTAFMKSMVAYYLLTGDCFAYPVGTVEVWPLMSQNMEIIEGESLENPIARYEYTEYNRRRMFQPEDLLHIKTFNPSSRVNGLSIIQVARSILDSQILGERWNKDVLKNDGAPAGAWVLETTLTPEQMEEMKAAIKEAQADNQSKGEPLIYGGGMKWEQFAMSHRDMEWVLIDKRSVQKMCAVLHYPPELLGEADQKTYSNMESALKHLHLNTIIPLGKSMLDGFNHFFFPKGNSWFEICEKDIAIIQESTTEMVNALASAHWLRWNEKREKMGYPVDESELGDQYLIPAGSVLSDDMLIGDPGEGKE